LAKNNLTAPASIGPRRQSPRIVLSGDQWPIESLDGRIPGMSVAQDDDEIPFDRRRFWRMVGASVALLTAAGALMWLRFGSGIFFDMLAAVQSCF
jgi:hypothetical protein